MFRATSEYRLASGAIASWERKSRATRNTNARVTISFKSEPTPSESVSLKGGSIFLIIDQDKAMNTIAELEIVNQITKGMLIPVSREIVNKV
jgi:hypothetical protein